MIQSTFQIIHEIKNNLLSTIAACIQNVFENYYKEVSIEDCITFVKINYNYESNGTSYICNFSFEADLDSYDLYDHHAFLMLLKNAMIESGMVKCAIKLQDSSRLEEYTLYYQQIAILEMRLREVLSFILSDCLNGGYYQLMSGQKPIPLLKGVVESEKENELKARGENELFYLTFNQYKQIVVPDYVNAGYLKDMIIRLSGDELKTGLNHLKVFDCEAYRDFLASIREDLSSLEQFRNCIAHNRKYSDEEWGNYIKASENLDKAISRFWESFESRDETEGFSFFEKEALSILVSIMDCAKWHTRKKEVHIPKDIDEVHHRYDKIESYDELVDYLADKAYDKATAYFPSDEEFREIAEHEFSGNKVAKKILSKYNTQLRALKWT